MLTVVLLLGLAAGAMTTLAGLGGGLMLVLALSVLVDPWYAVAITAPALLVGNLHRLIMYRRFAEWRLVRPLVLGIVPSALIVGLFTARLPAWVLYSLMATLTGLAVLKTFMRWQWRVPHRVLPLFGAGFGGIGASAGGGSALLLAPLLLSEGLTAERYIATGAACGTVMHGSRMIAYSVGGTLPEGLLVDGIVLILAVAGGNWIAARIRPYMTAPMARRVELGGLVVAVIMSIGGFTAR